MTQIRVLKHLQLNQSRGNNSGPEQQAAEEAGQSAVRFGVNPDFHFSDSLNTNAQPLLKLVRFFGGGVSFNLL